MERLGVGTVLVAWLRSAVLSGWFKVFLADKFTIVSEIVLSCM